MSIRLKILIWFSLLGIIPTMIIGIYYAWQSEQSIQNKVLEMSVTTTGQTVAAINDRISYLEKTINTAVQNEAMLETLTFWPDQDVVNRAFASRALANYFNAVVYNSSYIKTIVLIPNNGEVDVYGAGIAREQTSPTVQYFLNESFRNSDWYSDISGRANEIQWKIIDTGKERLVCIVKNFGYFLYARQLGVVVTIVDETAFSEYISAQNEDTGSVIVSESGYNLETGQEMGVAPFSIPPELTPVETGSDFIIAAPLKNGWSYANKISKEYLYRDTQKMRVDVVFFVLLTSAAFFSMAVFASFSIGNRVKRLVHKFERLQTGDFTVDTQLRGRDELSDIERSYNQTVGQLAQLIDQNYVYRLEKQEAQLSVLQYQINPHFLYNMLEVVNSLAAVHGAKDIQEVSQRLGRLYRYNTNRGSGVETHLKDEVEHSKNYLYLQNIQMSGQLQTYFDLEEGAEQCQIIRFVLQPVLENCMKHAFEGKQGPYCIEVTSARVDDGLVISVIDDGVGIAPERLAHILTEILGGAEPQSAERLTGVGLRNVNSRLRLKYGPQYGLDIISEPGSGTTVAIHIPYHVD